MIVALDFGFDFLDLSQPPAADDSAVLRREQFAQANASLTLEGMNIDTADFEIQEAVATGVLSTDEAVALYIKRIHEGAGS